MEFVRAVGQELGESGGNKGQGKGGIENIVSQVGELAGHQKEGGTHSAKGEPEGLKEKITGEVQQAKSGLEAAQKVAHLKESLGPLGDKIGL